MVWTFVACIWADLCWKYNLRARTERDTRIAEGSLDVGVDANGIKRTVMTIR